MARVLISVVVGLLLASVALARPNNAAVPAADPVVAVAWSGAEEWWLLEREGNRWTRWDGPYATEDACIFDGMDWQRANPRKIFTCATPPP